MGDKGTACVTGATSGIGMSFAWALARRGYDLLLTGRDAEKLGQTTKAIHEAYGVDARWKAGDLARTEDQDTLCALLASCADLALLVNNAGTGSMSPLAHSSVAEIRAMLSLNAGAVAALSLAALPAIRRNSGTIINVASGAAFMAMAGAAVYGGTKAFVTQFSRSLAQEIESDGCTVQALVPGLTRTNLGGGATNGFFDQFPPEWVMQPDDLVQASLIAMDRKETVCAPGVHDDDQISAALQAMDAVGQNASNRAVAQRYSPN